MLTKNFTRVPRVLLTVLLAGPVLALTGCTTHAERPLVNENTTTTDQTADEIFTAWKEAIIGTIAVNGREKGFRHGRESPFIPENLKTYRDAPSFGNCPNTQDDEQTSSLSDNITNYTGDSGGPEIPDPEQAAMNVSDYWKTHGWKVKHVYTETDGSTQISTTTDRNIKLVYSVHRNGESLIVESPCHKDFEAEVFKRTYGDKTHLSAPLPAKTPKPRHTASPTRFGPHPQ